MAGFTSDKAKEKFQTIGSGPTKSSIMEGSSLPNGTPKADAFTAERKPENRPMSDSLSTSAPQPTTRTSSVSSTSHSASSFLTNYLIQDGKESKRAEGKSSTRLELNQKLFALLPKKNERTSSQSQLKAIEQCIEQGADVNALGTEGRPLHLAIAAGNFEVMDLLLNKQAKTYLADKAFKAPLAMVRENKVNDERIPLYLARKRTPIAEEDMGELLKLCQIHYVGDSVNEASDQAILDYAVSCLAGVQVGNLLREDGNHIKYLAQLKSISGEAFTLTEAGKKIRHEMDTSSEIISLPLRIRKFWEILVLIKCGQISSKDLPVLFADPDKNREEVVKRLYQEIKIQLEMLHLQQTLSCMPRTIKAKENFYDQVACNMADRLQEIAEGEEYSFVGGWLEHAVYIRFIGQPGNKLVVCIDNLGEGCDLICRQEKDEIVLEQGERKQKKEIYRQKSDPSFPLAFPMPFKLHASPKLNHYYSCVLGQISKNQFSSATDERIPYLPAIIKACEEIDGKKALPRIYNFRAGFKPDPQRPNESALQLPLGVVQTVENCVVANGQLGLQARLERGLGKNGPTLYKWICDRELELASVSVIKEVDDLTFCWELQTQPAALPRRKKQAFKSYYQAQNTFLSLFDGRTFPMDQRYIHLAILEAKEHALREEKLGEDKKDERQETKEPSNSPLDSLENKDHTKEEVRIGFLGTFEDMHSSKKALQSPTDIFNFCKNPQQRHALVLGRAGIGKSTFCQYIMHQWANDKIWREFQWVFRIPLRNLTQAHYPATTPYSVADIVRQECFPKELLAEWDIEPLLALLANEKILWILDGYDELPNVIPPQLAQALSDLKTKPDLIITARPQSALALKTKLPMITEFEIIGFADEDIEAYVENFYRTLPEPPSSEDSKRLPKSAPNLSPTATSNRLEVKAEAKPEVAADYTASLMNFLRTNPNVWGIAHIPINLELICNLWSNPDYRMSADQITITILYQQLLHWLIKRHLIKEGFPESVLTARNMHLLGQPTFAALEQLAFETLQETNNILFPLTRLEACLRARAKNLAEFNELQAEVLGFGILKTTEKNECYFLHLTFQEFFAARCLVDKLQQPAGSEDFKQARNFIADHKYDPRFLLVMVFAAGLLSADKNETALTPLVHFWDMLEAEPRDISEMAHQSLIIRCLEESSCDSRIPKHQMCIEQIGRGITESIRFASKESFIYHSQWRHNIAPLLCQSPSILQNSAIIKVVTDALESAKDKMYGIAIFKAVGSAIAAESVIKLIIKAFENGDDFLRHQTILAFTLNSAIRNELVHNMLLKALDDRDANIRWAAAHALCKTGITKDKEWVRDALIKNLEPHNSDQVRESSVAALILLTNKTVTEKIVVALTNAILNDKSSIIWKNAIFALKEICTTAKIRPALEIFFAVILKESNTNKIRIEQAMSALYTFSEASPDLVLAMLIRSWNDHGASLAQLEVIQIIAAIGPPAAKEPRLLLFLIACLQHKKCRVREGAADALKEMGKSAATTEVISALKAAVQSETDYEVQCAAITALGAVGGAAEASYLIEILKSSQEHLIRYFAVKALGDLNAPTPEVLDCLAECIVGQYDTCRAEAIEALEKLGESAATDQILKKLIAVGLQEKIKIPFLVRVLGEMGAETAIDSILESVVKAALSTDRNGSAYEILQAAGKTAATTHILTLLARALQKKEDRYNALAILDILGTAAAKEPILTAIAADLEQTLKRQSSSDFRLLAHIVRNMGEASATQPILSVLCKAIPHLNSVIMEAAASTLGKMGAVVPKEPKILKSLLKALKNTDRNIKARAIRTLLELSSTIKIIDMDIIDSLADVLYENKDFYISHLIIKILLAIGSKATTSKVLTTFSKAAASLGAFRADDELYRTLSLELAIKCYFTDPTPQYALIIARMAVFQGAGVVFTADKLCIYGRQRIFTMPLDLKQEITHLEPLRKAFAEQAEIWLGRTTFLSTPQFSESKAIKAENLNGGNFSFFARELKDLPSAAAEAKITSPPISLDRVISKLGHMLGPKIRSIGSEGWKLTKEPFAHLELVRFLIPLNATAIISTLSQKLVHHGLQRGVDFDFVEVTKKDHSTWLMLRILNINHSIFLSEPNHQIQCLG
jgi:HEAT repeat protein